MQKNTFIKVLITIQCITILSVPEILLSFYLAQLYGKLLVLATICLVSLVGLYLITNSMLHVAKNIRSSSKKGAMEKSNFGALYLLLICGLLLILPGFISSIIGFILYVPPVRLLGTHVMTRVFSKKIEKVYAYTKLYS